MKKIWVNKTNSFEKAEECDLEYYLDMTETERLEIVQQLREEYFKRNQINIDEYRKALRRHIKIKKQTYE